MHIIHSTTATLHSCSLSTTCVLTPLLSCSRISIIWYQSCVLHSCELPHCIPHARNSQKSDRKYFFLLQLLENQWAAFYSAPRSISDAGIKARRPSSIRAQLSTAVSSLFQSQICSKELRFNSLQPGGNIKIILLLFPSFPKLVGTCRYLF